MRMSLLAILISFCGMAFAEINNEASTLLLNKSLDKKAIQKKLPGVKVYDADDQYRAAQVGSLLPSEKHQIYKSAQVDKYLMKMDALDKDMFLLRVLNYPYKEAKKHYSFLQQKSYLQIRKGYLKASQ